jgi:hypothetical protein
MKLDDSPLASCDTLSFNCRIASEISDLDKGSRVKLKASELSSNKIEVSKGETKGGILSIIFWAAPAKNSLNFSAIIRGSL